MCCPIPAVKSCILNEAFMNTLSGDQVLTNEELAQWQRDGFFIARGLLPEAEPLPYSIISWRCTRRGRSKACSIRAALEESNGDILKHFPRFMHPHRADKLSFDIMLDARLRPILRDGFGEDASRGAVHVLFQAAGRAGPSVASGQFLPARAPGNCMAAWLSLDDADAENGGMFVVPGSHRAGVLCPHVADMANRSRSKKWTCRKVCRPVPVDLEAGDVLFFNGSVIHGSYPNTPPQRFRRAFICHYVPQSLTEMSADIIRCILLMAKRSRGARARKVGFAGARSGTRFGWRVAHRASGRRFSRISLRVHQKQQQ